ncbi:MAG: hypothetical protein ACJA2Q_000209 [Pseudohongiellaceae bacterium]|jgi:hypothetical protein
MNVFRLNYRSLIAILPKLNRGLLALIFSLLVGVAYGQSNSARSIVAIGDIHGDYDNFKKVLIDAGLIDRRGNWIAGDTRFVQLGDLPDRGPDTDKIIEQMQKLQHQAEKSGGEVFALIGNHEAMNMYGDLRYVHPGEYEALKGRNSRQLRSRYYDVEIARLTAADESFVASDAFEKQWLQSHPLGYVEHRIAWSPEGKFGSWVIANRAIVKVGRTLFLHGGVSTKLLGMSIDTINDQVKRELGGDLPEELGLSEADDGPLWYRGLASNDEELEAPHVDAVLADFDVDRIVIGHTPGLGTIVPRFGGKVLIIDAGIAKYYGSHLASLRIEEDNYFTVQNGEKVLLPSNNSQMLAYFERMAQEEPTRALLNHLEGLKR